MRADCHRAKRGRRNRAAPTKTEANADDFQAPPALPVVVRQPRQSRHDGALSGALSQLRPHQGRAVRRQAHHRHCPDRLGSRAVQPPSHRAGQARARRHPRCRRHRVRVPGASDPGDRQAPDRNLAYLGLVEVLYGYPLDGVVLMTGCDKTTPACLMAAATVDLPAIVLSGGPMLNGWWKGERSGSGTAVWNARQEHAAGRIDYKEFIDIVPSSAPSVGHCNTMGTASTMNALAEALGMSLPGCAAIPAPYRER